MQLSFPLVTIVIPTYNRAHLITQTLQCLKVQTYQNWECIVVDDSSNDNTKEAVEEFCQNDRRFVYVKNQKSKGAPGARNTGLDLAKGEFISFFDSDDKLSPIYIDNKINHCIEDPNLDLVISLSKWIENGKEKCFTNIPTRDHPLIRFYSLYPNVDIPWFTPSLIKKSFLNKNDIRWDETVLAYQDIQFNVTMLANNPAYLWTKSKFDWCWMGNVDSNNTSKQKHNEIIITKKLIEVYWSNLQSAKVSPQLKGQVLKQYHAQLIFFVDKLLSKVIDEKELYHFIVNHSNFSAFDSWLLKNRMMFIKNLPSNLKKRVFWVFIRKYFNFYYSPVIKKGNYLKHTEFTFLQNCRLMLCSGIE
jgi:glycosyltransferase involved in cell wall biosynthesis